MRARLAGPENPGRSAIDGICPRRATRACATTGLASFWRIRPCPCPGGERSLFWKKRSAPASRAGATVREGWPADFKLAEMVETYLFHLGAFDFSMKSPAVQEQTRGDMRKQAGGFAEGALSGFAEWQTENRKRLGYRALWERYFADVDVFLLPATITAAFPHDQSQAHARMIPFPEGGAPNLTGT